MDVLTLQWGWWGGALPTPAVIAPPVVTFSLDLARRPVLALEAALAPLFDLGVVRAAEWELER